MKTNTLLLCGRQTSGKGTIAYELYQKYGWKHFSVGKVCRAEIANDTNLGKKLKYNVENGLINPPELISILLRKYLDKTNDKQIIIFDALARDIAQYEAFEPILAEYGRSDYTMMHIDISEATARQRVLYRRTCSQCEYIVGLEIPLNTNICPKCASVNTLVHRTDDTLAIIDQRLSLYNTETIPVLYRSRTDHTVIDIDGSISRYEILKQIEKMLEIKE